MLSVLHTPTAPYFRKTLEGLVSNEFSQCKTMFTQTFKNFFTLKSKTKEKQKQKLLSLVFFVCLLFIPPVVLGSIFFLLFFNF